VFKCLDGSAKVKVHIIVRLYKEADRQMVGRMKQKENRSAYRARASDDCFQRVYSRCPMFRGQSHF